MLEEESYHLGIVVVGNLAVVPMGSECGDVGEVDDVVHDVEGDVWGGGGDCVVVVDGDVDGDGLVVGTTSDFAELHLPSDDQNEK